MNIEKGKLRDLTAEVDQLHHEGLRTLHQQLGDAHLDLTRGPDRSADAVRQSRRRFLRGSLVGGAALTAAAAVGPGGGLLPTAFAQDGPSKFPSPDEKIAGVAQTLERAAVTAYGLVIPKLTDSDVVDAATTFQGHHADHAKALGKVLKQSDTQIEKVAADPALVMRFQTALQGAADQNAALQVALQVELAAAATYLDALSRLAVGFNANAVATILPVESQHAAVIETVLGQPVTTVLPNEIPSTGGVDLSSYASTAS